MIMELTIEDELRIARRHLTKAVSKYAKEKTRADRLQEKLDIALEALEFYADTGNWGSTSDGESFMISEDIELFEGLPYGGKIARSVLAEIKGE